MMLLVVVLVKLEKHLYPVIVCIRRNPRTRRTYSYAIIAYPPHTSSSGGFFALRKRRRGRRRGRRGKRGGGQKD